MADDDRPDWPFTWSEKEARWWRSASVKSITHHWEFASADTSREWLRLEFAVGDDQGSRDLPIDFFNDHPFLVFKPDHRSLIRFREGTRQVLSTLDDIDAWEEANKRDRAEYDRLKIKFGDA